MRQDEDHAEQSKKDELTMEAVRALGTLSSMASVPPALLSDYAAAVVDSFAQVTPPEAPPLTFSVVTLREGGSGGAESVKPGNVRLNMRRLISAVASGVLAAVGVPAFPWTAPFAGLVLWNELRGTLSIQITEIEAAVIWALWVNRDEDDRVAASDVLALVNGELARHDGAPLTESEIQRALRTLERLHCIQRSRGAPNSWWLREWVRVNYR